MVEKKKKTRSTSSSVDPATQYAMDVISGKVIAGPDIRNACQRHLRDLKEGGKRGLNWDVESVTGVQVRMLSGWGNIRTKGVVMSGGSVRSAYNKVFADRNSGSWDMTRNRNIAMPILILPNMY